MYPAVRGSGTSPATGHPSGASSSGYPSYTNHGAAHRSELLAPRVLPIDAAPNVARSQSRGGLMAHWGGRGSRRAGTGAVVALAGRRVAERDRPRLHWARAIDPRGRCQRRLRARPSTQFPPRTLACRGRGDPAPPRGRPFAADDREAPRAGTLGGRPGGALHGVSQRHRATWAHDCARRRARRPEACKPATNSRLRRLVAAYLAVEWSPSESSAGPACRRRVRNPSGGTSF